MYWYGSEALIPADPARGMKLTGGAQIPLTCRYIARRFVEHVTEQKGGDLEPWVKAVRASHPDTVLSELLRGAQEGFRGRKSVPMPKSWPQAYEKLSQYPNRKV